MQAYRAWLPVIILIFGVSFFYLYTLAPSLNWADGARMQMDVMFGGSTYMSFDEARQIPTDGLPFSRLGVAAWDHPLYVIIAQLFRLLPVSDPLYGINLMSAFFGVLTVAIVYLLGIYLTGNPWAAALGSLSLAVAHTFWFHSVTSEAYTLHTFLMALIILLTLRWPLLKNGKELGLLAFLAGLGLANHVMLILVLVPAGIYLLIGQLPSIRKRYTRQEVHSAPKKPVVVKQALIAILLFVVGLAPWWIQFLRMARIIGFPLSLQLASGFPWLGNRYGVSSLLSFVLNIAGYTGWLLFQFTPAGCALGIYGFWKMGRLRLDAARLLVSMLILNVLFSANYSLADQFNFHLPSYLIFSLGIIFGIASLWERIRQAVLSSRPVLRASYFAGMTLVILSPVGIYALIPWALRSLGYTEQRLQIPPIGLGARDAFDYFLNPDSRGDDSAARFARSTLANLPPDALVFTPKPTDQETYVVLRYMQLIDGMQPDVHLELMLFNPEADIRQGILNMIREQQACHPIYLASLNSRVFPVEAIQTQFTIVPESNLFHLVPRIATQISSNCPDIIQLSPNIPAGQLIRMAMRRQ